MPALLAEAEDVDMGFAGAAAGGGDTAGLGKADAEAVCRYEGAASSAGIMSWECASDDAEADPEDEECDLGVDYQNAWAGAAYGVPLAEAKRVMPECFVGRGRATRPEVSRCTMLQEVVRVDRRLLRDRLSHLAEGEYDLTNDVVRTMGQRVESLASMVAPTDKEATFRRRAAPASAKTHARKTTSDAALE